MQFWTVVLHWTVSVRLQLLEQLRPSLRLEKRRPAVVDTMQRFKFGGDGDPVEASFAVTLPVQIGDAKTAVSVYLTCLDCRHHAKWTHQTGPTFQQFLELQRKVQTWWAKLQQRRGLCAGTC